MKKNKILYKYRSWKNDIQKAPLVKSQLYLSSPKDFNDPFDCRIPANFIEMNQDEKEEYAEIMIKNHANQMIENGYDLDVEYKNILNRLKDVSLNDQKDFEERTYSGYDRHLGVLSLSERWDSILMWSHYAECHKGYCIGFHKEKLTTSSFFGAGGPVIYPKNENFPKISPVQELKQESQFLATHHKALDWEYECEYRFTKLQYPKPFEISERKISVPNSYIAEVIIGFKTDPLVEEEITELCKNKNIPVYKLENEPFKFKLVRKVI